MSLTEFLLARIAEDEAHAGLVLDRTGPWDAPPISPERTMAECEAKRRIIELADQVENMEASLMQEFGGTPDDDDPSVMMLRALALPYADHPDYDEGWRP
jgi:hypothetical protein